MGEMIGRVAIREWRTDAPVCLAVMLHGYTEHVGRYDELAQALAARRVHVVGPDHIGHGRSPGERALLDDFDEIAADVRGVVLAKRDALPVVLLGHSMGGLIAIRYAQLFREDLAGMVLSAPAVGMVPFLEAVLAAPEIPEAGFDGTLLSRDPAVGDDYAADPLVWHGPWQRGTLEAALAANRAVEAGPTFGDLPLLYLHGADDQIIAADAAQRVVERLAGPDSVFHLLPHQRHEIFNEIGKEATFAMVGDFIASASAHAGARSSSLG